jgi:hypothetical protein
VSPRLSFPLHPVARFHWLKLHHYYGLIRHLQCHRFGFPLRVIPPLPVLHLQAGTCSASPGQHTVCSIHPDPNHVSEFCRSSPFTRFPAECANGTGFPGFSAGHPALPPPLVHILFRAGLCLQTFQIPLHRRHPVHPSLLREDVASATAL